MEMKGSFGDAVPDEILKSAMGCKGKSPISSNSKLVATI
jgi:hypothetical protein